MHNLESSFIDDGAHHNWAALAQHVPQRSSTWEDRELPYLHPVYSFETSGLPVDRVACGGNWWNALSSQELEVKHETGLHENRWVPRWPHELPVSTLLPLQLSVSSWYSSLWQASPFPCLYCCWPRSIFPLVGLGEYVLTEICFHTLCFGLFVLRFHYIALVGLEVTIWIRLALNSEICLSLLNAGMKGLYHHAWHAHLWVGFSFLPLFLSCGWANSPNLIPHTLCLRYAIVVLACWEQLSLLSSLEINSFN